MKALRNSCFIVPIIVGFCGLTAANSKPNDSANREHIEGLVKKLGDDECTERQKAARELEAIGEPALELLRMALTDPDLEVSKQAKDLVERISGRRITRIALT